MKKIRPCTAQYVVVSVNSRTSGAPNLSKVCCCPRIIHGRRRYLSHASKKANVGASCGHPAHVLHSGTRGGILTWTRFPTRADSRVRRGASPERHPRWHPLESAKLRGVGRRVTRGDSYHQLLACAWGRQIALRLGRRRTEAVSSRLVIGWSKRFCLGRG